MIFIFIVDREWNIGKDNDLLFTIKEDQQMFKEKTTGNINLMGRRTFESLPREDGLPNRVNIVLTEEEDREDKEDLYFVNSVDETYDLIERLLEEEPREVYCIGGADIADQVIDQTSKAIITKVDAVFEADTRMMNLDELDDWEIEEESEVYYDEENDLDYKYVIYNRID